jgi:hypothetical protein
MLRPVVSRLEERTLLSTITWAADVSGDWDNAAMWTGGVVPGAGDDAVVSFGNITVTHSSAVGDSVDSVNCQEPLDLTSGSLTIDTTSPSQHSSTVSGQFNLSGASLQLVSGTLNLSGGGTTSGSITVAAGTTLGLSGQDLTSSSVISSQGYVDFGGCTEAGRYSTTGDTAAGSTSFTGPVTLGSSLYVGRSGTVSFAPAAGGPVTLATGTLYVDYLGVLAGTDSFAADGMTTLAPDSELSTSGAVDAYGGLRMDDGYYPTILSGTTLNNHGAATLDTTGGAGQSGFELAQGAAINNLAGASFAIIGPAVGYGGTISNRDNSAVSFTNAGTLTCKLDGASSFDINVPFSNSGSVVQQGALNASNFTNSGTVTVAAGASFNGSGSVQSPVIVPSGNTVTTTAGETISSGLFVAGGTLDVTGSLTVDGQLTLGPGSTLTGGGTVNAYGGLAIDVGNGESAVPSPIVLSGTTLNNYGVATFNAGLNFNSGMFLEGGAVFNNLAGASFTIVSLDGAIVAGDGSAVAFNNAGTLTCSAGAGLSIAVPFSNSGSVIVQQGGALGFNNASNSGTVTVASSASLDVSTYTQTAGSTVLNGGTINGGSISINGGALSGTGTINATVTNGGQVIPGGTGAAGTLTINGNYTQTAAGALDIKLGGTTAGTQYSQLTVSGTAALGGTLSVATIGSFAPAFGNLFQVLTFGSSSGTFTTYQGPTLASGLFLDTVFNSTSLTLDIDSVAISGAPAFPLEGIPIALTGAVTGPSSGNSFTFSWNVTQNGNPFGSGSGTTFAFTPNLNGTYLVTLTVTDVIGSTGTATVPIVVAPSIFILNPTASGALTVSGNASITIPGEIVVDSSSTSALSAAGKAQITASAIDVQGGFQKTGSATLSPAPATGVSVADPLGTLATPSPTGLTNYGSMSFTTGTHTICPGIYTQIKVSGNAHLHHRGRRPHGDRRRQHQRPERVPLQHRQQLPLLGGQFRRNHAQRERDIRSDRAGLRALCGGRDLPVPRQHARPVVQRQRPGRHERDHLCPQCPAVFQWLFPAPGRAGRGNAELERQRQSHPDRGGQRRHRRHLGHRQHPAGRQPVGFHQRPERPVHQRRAGPHPGRDQRLGHPARPV